MTRINEYQDNSVNSYQTNLCYSNIDLSLIKNEPVESVDYLTPTQQFHQSDSPNQQQTFFYFCQQQNQQFSPQLPPTPPSPNSLNSNDTIDQLKIKNQNSNLNNLQINIQINNQINNQTSNQINNQINKNYLQQSFQTTTNKQQTHFELPQQSNQQMDTKYRKTNKNPQNNLKTFNLSKQITKKQMKSSASTAKRNERERKRVRSVNFGFQNLRERLPIKDKKLSKVETLRSAVQYIRKLKEMLNSPDCTANINKNELLFNFIQQNTTLSNAIKNESNNEFKNQKIVDHQDPNSSSSLDYFDLDELLS